MKIGFIGCGNMGGALARAVSRASCTEIYTADTAEDKARELAKECRGVLSTAQEIAAGCECIFIGVKPAGVVGLLTALGEGLSTNRNALIVCMAAGVSISQIEAALPCPMPVIRIMPNTPVGFGRGMTLASANRLVTDGIFSDFLAIMEHTGKVDRIDERYIDAGSAVSGSGPAFVYMFLDALAEGGVAAGLTREKALAYAEQTLIGAATVARDSGKTPDKLTEEVCSPGGSTIEGVRTLREGRLCEVVKDAVCATYEKAKTLGK